RRVDLLGLRGRVRGRHGEPFLTGPATRVSRCRAAFLSEMSPTPQHEALDPELLEALRRAADEAGDRSYVRYSGFVVKAAVETVDDRVYGGSNVEVVNFSLTKHAEEVAIINAINDGVFARRGDQWLRTLYVQGVPPCGSCRQFAYEWATEDARCVIDRPGKPEVLPLSRL